MGGAGVIATSRQVRLSEAGGPLDNAGLVRFSHHLTVEARNSGPW